MTTATAPTRGDQGHARRTPRRFSLFWRLTGIISLILLAGAAVLTAAAYSYARVAADNAYDRLLIGAARQISETVSAEAGAIVVAVPVSALETLSISRTDRAYYQVAAPDGTVITGYPDLPLPRGVAPATEASAVGDAEFYGFPIRTASVWRYIAEQGATGWVRTTVAQTREARNALTLELTLGGLLPVLAMSLLALVALMGAVRFGLRPLSRVEEALRRRDPNDLAPITLDTPEEVDALVEAINRLMDRLSDRLGAMQRYIETAAHQLRTPLTSISAQIEVLDRAEEGPAREAAIARLRHRAGEVGRLANQLLSHATVIHRGEAVLADRFDLRLLTQNVVPDSLLETRGRDITVRVSVPDAPIMVRGDRVALREAVRNLVENALRYGAHSHIAIGAEVREGQVRLTVADDGPGIAPDDWQRLRERFARGEGASDGAGLGLAIVSDVARAHKARLEAERCPDGDFVVALIFEGEPL